MPQFLAAICSSTQVHDDHNRQWQKKRFVFFLFLFCFVLCNHYGLVNFGSPCFYFIVNITQTTNKHLVTSKQSNNILLLYNMLKTKHFLPTSHSRPDNNEAIRVSSLKIQRNGHHHDMMNLPSEPIGALVRVRQQKHLCNSF